MLALPVAGMSAQGKAAPQDKPAKGKADCATCHGDLVKKKVVHAALKKGCASCHTGLEASAVPHKKTNSVKNGLSSEPPELCFMCHDKAVFNRKKVHPALATGCSSCHDSHSADNAKLLMSPVPELCWNCHDKKKFEGKTVHAPVTGGMCTSCHNPHSMDSERLLTAQPPALCFNCHDQDKFKGKAVHSPVENGMCSSCHSAHVSRNGALLSGPVNELCLACHPGDPIKTGQHLVAGFFQDKHPVTGKEDPKRPGAPLTCASCHKPHSSDWYRLFRYEAQSSYDTCQHCHEK